jgi:hypothetical protein
MQHFLKITLTKGARFQHPHYWLPHQLPVKQTAADRGHGHKKPRAAVFCRPGKMTVYIIAGHPPASLTVSNIRQPDLVPFELDTALRPEMAPVQIWR